jgi:hypothetical protein
VKSLGWLALGCALAAWPLAGCATTPPREGAASPMPTGATGAAREPIPTPVPSPTPAPASPMPGTRVGSTASGGAIVSTRGRPAVLDTMPNADARAVLQTIPEPLAAGERVPPRVTSSPPAGGSGAAPDTAASTPPDTVGSDAEGDVPVPEPTQPLGDRPRPAVRDTTPAAPSPAPSAPAPSSAPAVARPETCWRVQLAAVPETNRAQRLKSAAESQLDVTFVVEKEKSLYKLRTRDCLDAAAADRLRQRATLVGFSGAFRFRDPKQ